MEAKNLRSSANPLLFSKTLRSASSPSPVVMTERPPSVVSAMISILTSIDFMCENMLIQVINNRQNKVDTCGLVDAKKNKKTVNRSMSLQAVEVELPVCNGGILNHPTFQVLIGFPAQSYLQPEGDKRAHAPHVCRLLKKKRRCQTQTSL